MNQKPWYQSKTIWFNVITLALQVVNLFSNSPLFADKMQVLGVLTVIQTVGNIALRFITNTGVTL